MLSSFFCTTAFILLLKSVFAAASKDQKFGPVGYSSSHIFDDEAAANSRQHEEAFSDHPNQISCSWGDRVDELYARYPTPCTGFEGNRRYYAHGIDGPDNDFMDIDEHDRIIYVKVRICDRRKYNGTKGDQGRICSMYFETSTGKHLQCGPDDTKRPLPPSQVTTWNSPNPAEIGLKYFVGQAGSGIDRIGFTYGKFRKPPSCK